VVESETGVADTLWSLGLNVLS